MWLDSTPAAVSHKDQQEVLWLQLHGVKMFLFNLTSQKLHFLV